MGKPRHRLFILSLIAVLMLSVACDEDDDDDGPDNQPDFSAGAFGENPFIDLRINLIASRISGDVFGLGVVTIGDERFTFEVIDAILSTDEGGEDPIPQTDPDQARLICTPAFAQLRVRLFPGNLETTLFLNECEHDNPEMFVENGVIINPCTGEEVIGDEQIERFRGVCLDTGITEPTRDTIVLEELNGLCGDSPCTAIDDAVILVPEFQD